MTEDTFLKAQVFVKAPRQFKILCTDKGPD